MGTCFVCGKEVEGNADSELFGCDGDRIHKSCKPNLNKAYNSINNMSNAEFNNYIKGERELLDSWWVLWFITKIGGIYETNKTFLEKHPENKDILEKQLEIMKNDIIEYVTSARFKSALEYLNL